VSATTLDGWTRDSQEIDALVTDHYLESILAAHARGADIGPILIDLRPDRDIRLVAERLARDLPRFHPSFRFEETLAARLQGAAVRMRLPLAAGGESGPTGLPIGDPYLALGAIDDDRVLLLGDPRLAIGRPFLVGGALTSAALSIAGAVYVAWRMRHPQSTAMARAVRAISRTRLA
jgi:hypothetical protein